MEKVFLSRKVFFVFIVPAMLGMTVDEVWIWAGRWLVAAILKNIVFFLIKMVKTRKNANNSISGNRYVL